MAQVARVQEQLLLRWPLLARAEGNAVQAAGEPLGDREQLERAERLPKEGVCADLVCVLDSVSLGAGQQDDADVGGVLLALQLPAELEAAHARHVDVQDDYVWLALGDALERNRRRVCLVDLDVEDLERRSEQFPQSLIVIYEQKPHLRPPIVVSWAPRPTLSARGT